MALTWPAKASGETYVYTWVPPFDGSVQSHTVTVNSGGVSVSSTHDGAGVNFEVSGGANGVAVLTVTATSADGEVAQETIYLPIVATTNALANTVRDVCKFAHRKVSGLGSDPDADEMADLIERLEGIIASWKTQGADLGIPLPLTEAQVLYCPDYAIRALRNTLIVEMAPLYTGYDLSPQEVQNALRGLQQVKTALIPDDRYHAEYF